MERKALYKSEDERQSFSLTFFALDEKLFIEKDSIYVRVKVFYTFYDAVKQIRIDEVKKSCEGHSSALSLIIATFLSHILCPTLIYSS